MNTTKNTVNSNTAKAFRALAASAALTLVAAGASLAWSVPVGTTVVSSCTQNGTLSNGSLFTLYTNVYQTGNTYTTQYDLRNVNDAAGLIGMDADFGYAGTSGMNLFFGDAPDASGIVYHDGSVGSSITNNGSIDYNTHAATMKAGIYNGQVIWQPTCTTLKAGQDSFSQFGFNNKDQYGTFGYLYVQTTAKPIQNTIYVADGNYSFGSVTGCGSAPCGGTTSGTPSPAAVPEPAPVASMGLGGLGVIGLLLRARKRAAKAA